MTRRLVCVVEGRGEVRAVPGLCARVLYQLLDVSPTDWVVDQDPIRQPRGRLVDEGAPARRRGPAAEGVDRAVALAAARGASACVVLVDADRDCPVAWGPATRARVLRRLPGAAVMPVREYEAWLLAGHPEWAGEEDVGSVKNPKARAEALWHGYKPTVHQLARTRSMDLSLARRRSASFAYFVAQLATLVR